MVGNFDDVNCVVEYFGYVFECIFINECNEFDFWCFVVFNLVLVGCILGSIDVCGCISGKVM